MYGMSGNNRYYMLVSVCVRICVTLLSICISIRTEISFSLYRLYFRCNLHIYMSSEMQIFIIIFTVDSIRSVNAIYT